MAVAAHFDPDDPYAPGRHRTTTGATARGRTLSIRGAAIRWSSSATARANGSSRPPWSRLCGASAATRCPSISGPSTRPPDCSTRAPGWRSAMPPSSPSSSSQPEALLEVTRRIIAPAREASAVDAFKAQYRLADLKRRADALIAGLDCVLTPTAPTIYRIAEVEADPIGLNSRLGTYTNFMNLLDLAAVAVPAGLPRRRAALRRHPVRCRLQRPPAGRARRAPAPRPGAPARGDRSGHAGPGRSRGRRAPAR